VTAAHGRVVLALDGLQPDVIFPRFRGQSDYAASAATCTFNSNSIGLL